VNQATALADTLETLQRALGEALAAGGDLREMMLGERARGMLPLLRLPRRFDMLLLERVLLPAAGDRADAGTPTAFAELTDAGLVDRVPGRPGWWRAAPASGKVAPTGAPWAPGGQAWQAAHLALAAHFDAHGEDGELESVYHRLAAGSPSAEATWGELYNRACVAFDLARCETLLQLLDDGARFISVALATRGTRERGLLGARAALAEDHARTTRYLERAPLLQAFEALLGDTRHFILQLHAPGGSGKTMFLRWLGPRWCLERRVPIARVDLDFLDVSERGMASAFMLGKLAERLDLQLPGAPLLELLRDVAEERRRACDSPQRLDAAALATLETEVRERLARVLVERCAGQPVLLVLDTLEDAAIKHQLDMLALVRAIAALRECMLAMAGPGGAPRLLLLLSGRYALHEQHPAIHAEFKTQLVVFPIPPFDANESLRYLQQRLTGASPPPAAAVLAAAVERARGNPFKLSLYADILLATPGIAVEELGQGVDVDMLYLIQRVLARLDDDALHWLLRYGVLARRLTRDFVEQVLLAPMRASMRGERRHDDPAQDGVAHRDWPRLWRARRAEPLRRDEVAGLWQRLRSYASASSWISVDVGSADAVVIQPIAGQPMRRALLQQDRRVVTQIHRAAIAHARHARQARDAGDQADALADLTYHDFQLRGPRAATAWWARVEHALRQPDEGEAVLALAAVVLSDDLRESELAAPGPTRAPLIDAQTRARAFFATAVVHARRAADDREHETRARASFEQYDALASALPAPPCGLARDGLLRLQLLGRDATQRQRALQTLEAALATRLDTPTRGKVLRALKEVWALQDAQRSRRFARRWGLWAWRARDARQYGAYLVDESRTRVRGGAVAAALNALIIGRGELTNASSRWLDPAELREARRRVAQDEAPALVAAGLFDAARVREAQVYPPGQPLADEAQNWHRARQQAALVLGAGDPSAALAALAGLFASLDDNKLEREPALRRRLELLPLQAQAQRQLLLFGPMLDSLSATLAAHSELGNHEGEVSTRLHMARVQLFDIGHLQQAAELLQDNDSAFASESADARAEHALLRASLAAFSGRASDAMARLAQAEALNRELPTQPWAAAALLAQAGLRIAPPEAAVGYAAALADAWSRVDCASARLALAGELRLAPAVVGLPAALAQRLDRLTRVAALGLPGHRRLRPADRVRLTLQRTEVLRIIGRPRRAAEELHALRPTLAALPAGLWLRDVALCCDRLGIEPQAVLPSGWLSRLVSSVRRFPGLLAAVYLEAAERAERAGDAAHSAKLAGRSLKALGPNDGPPCVLHARQAALRARLLAAEQTEEEIAERRLQVNAMRQHLGWPPLVENAENAKDARATAPDAASSTDPGRTLPERIATVATGLRIHLAERAVRVDHLADGLQEERGSMPLPGRLAEVLGAMGDQRIVDAAAPALASLLVPRDAGFGLTLATAVLPEMLIERLWAAQRGTLAPLEWMVEHRRNGMHAMPWELLVPGLPAGVPSESAPARPLTLHPGMGCFWRAPAGFQLRQRVVWAQQALGLRADGRLGPATAAALSRFQREHGLSPSGGLDAATAQALARLATPGAPPRRVLLITPSRQVTVVTQRGAAATGTDLREIYAGHDLEVVLLETPSVDELQQMLRKPFDAVHLAAPVAQSRSSRELSLQFSAGYDSAHTTAFTPSLLCRLLKGTPLVVVDAPRPGSRDETVRQLLLRNAFAAHLFDQGELPAVVACGLGSPWAQHKQAQALARGMAEALPLVERVSGLREQGLDAPAGTDLLELSASAGIALFARDPYIPALPVAAR